MEYSSFKLLFCGGRHSGVAFAAAAGIFGRIFFNVDRRCESHRAGGGKFHAQSCHSISGALRLARECGVPVVPIALTGTADVLPKGARLISPAAMRVRIGDALNPNAASAFQLREQVIVLRGDHLPEPVYQACAA